MTFDDEESCKQAISDVRNDTQENDFVLFSYVDNNPVKKKLTKVATGKGGIEELKKFIENESSGTYYGLIRCHAVVQETKTIKFVFLTFIGEKIKVIEKAKITTHFGSVKDLIGQFHVDFFGSTLSELSADSLKEKVDAVTFNKK